MSNKTKKIFNAKRIMSITVTIMLIAILLSATSFSVLGNSSGSAAENTVKSVILLIPDGMSITDTTIARWYNGGAPLAMDQIMTGLVRTFNADTIFTDSAPAGTAYATGYKSNNGYISVAPTNVSTPGIDTDNYIYPKKPLATVLEGAKLEKKSTGLVVTCQIPHATPATFASHVIDRNLYYDIIEQEVYSKIDVVLGGGYDYLDPSKRKDKENLVQILKNMKYDYVTTKGQMMDSASDKIWGMFAPVAMDYDMDRDVNTQPSLSEMTQKAISVLSKNKNGFFLMVEGSKIDWADHANDPIGVVSDVLAFDKAVQAALDFARKDGNTAVVVCADHATGGMVLGYNGNWTTTYDSLVDALKKATLTGEGLEKRFDAIKTNANIKDVMKQFYGINDLSEDEMKAIAATGAGKMNSTVGKMLSIRTNIAWTSGEHTGEEVALYAWHPKNYTPVAYAGSGIVDNTDIGNYIAAILGIDLDKLNETQYIPAQDAFEMKGATVTLNKSNVNNPVLVVTKNKTTVEFPINKNIAKIKGRMVVKLSGLVVYTDAVYVPQDAINLIK